MGERQNSGRSARTVQPVTDTTGLQYRDRPASDRRDFERVRVRTALTLYYNDDRHELEGMCRDISESGMGIVVDYPLPMGTECNVRIHDGRTNSTRFQARIEILRVRPLESGRYLLGAVVLQRF